MRAERKSPAEWNELLQKWDKLKETMSADEAAQAVGCKTDILYSAKARLKHKGQLSSKVTVTELPSGMYETSRGSVPRETTKRTSLTVIMGSTKEVAQLLKELR